MAIKLGFIGFGIMGERLMRAALALDRNLVTVTGVFDPGPSARERLAAIDNNLVCYDAAQTLIAASDCLHIASPPASHLGYLHQCADANRAALCEKPLATDVAAAESSVGALVEQGMRAAVNFPFASSLAVDQLERWLNSGAAGEPMRVDIELGFANWPRSWQMDAVNWLDGRAEGGFTREVGSHFLFLSLRLLGSLKLERARCTYPEHGRSERAIDVMMTAGSLPVTLTGSVGATTKDDQNTWTLTGTKGRIRLRDWSFAEREIDGLWHAPADAVPNEKARPLVLARQLEKIAAMTRGEITNLATLQEALAVQRIVETILASSAA